MLDLETGPGALSWRNTGLAGVRSRSFAPAAGVGKVHLRVTGLEEALQEAAGRNCQCRCTAAAGSDQPESGSQGVRRLDYRLIGRAGKMKQAAADVVDTAAAAGYQRPDWEVAGMFARHQLDRPGKMERMIVVVAAAGSQMSALEAVGRWKLLLAAAVDTVRRVPAAAMSQTLALGAVGRWKILLVAAIDIAGWGSVVVADWHYRKDTDWTAAGCHAGRQRRSAFRKEQVWHISTHFEPCTWNHR